MKTHTIEGQRMLDRVGGVLREVGMIVRASHERWDGGGYPDGLAGPRIPREATVVAASDAFNAMTTDRSYRRARSADDALAEMRACAGTSVRAGRRLGARVRRRAQHADGRVGPFDGAQVKLAQRQARQPARRRRRARPRSHAIAAASASPIGPRVLEQRRARVLRKRQPVDRLRQRRLRDRVHDGEEADGEVRVRLRVRLIVRPGSSRRISSHSRARTSAVTVSSCGASCAPESAISVAQRLTACIPSSTSASRTEATRRGRLK